MINNRRILLAVDTSTDMLCCALARVHVEENGSCSFEELLADQDMLCRRHANEELVSQIEATLAAAKLSRKDIDAIIVGRGPGSFTGVRIGISTAKGLALALHKDLYGASTLDAAAWRVWSSGARGKLVVLGDAMRKELYPGSYELSDAGALRLFENETVTKADACIAALGTPVKGAEPLLTGDGLFKYKELCEEAGFTRYLDAELWHPSGEGLIRAALAAGLKLDEPGDPALVLPIYTRLSDAEESERERLGLASADAPTISGVADELASEHLQFRPMSVNDISQVAALEQEAFAELPIDAWSEQLFYDEFTQPGGTWWIAHDREKIIAFAGARLAGERLELHDVCVAKDYRGQGIARKLLERLAYDGQMLNASKMTLEVYTKNTEALHLYEKLGFEQVRTRVDYYGKGIDAFVMDAPLPLQAKDEAMASGTSSVRTWNKEVGARSPEELTKLQEAGALIVAIESSCDETAVAIVNDQGRILSSIVATQIDFHARFGGVVPEIASRKHTEAIVGCFEEALLAAAAELGISSLQPEELSAVAVTAGPGLVGALVVGVAFAKGLAFGAELPLIAVNHLEGHLFANLVETPDLTAPFVASLVSGGNTLLVHVKDWGDYEILGATIDDAVGEAFDKVSKALGLGYPGGPIISRLAAEGNPRAIDFPRAMLHSHDYRFSLSGLKTAVITYIQNENKAGRPVNLPDLAASFQAAVVDVQVAKAATAVEEFGVSDFCVGGGVAANPALRAAYLEEFGKRGVRVTVPPMSVCGDNAAMIGLAAVRAFQAGAFADLKLDANPNAALGTWSIKSANEFELFPS